MLARSHSDTPHSQTHTLQRLGHTQNRHTPHPARKQPRHTAHTHTHTPDASQTHSTHRHIHHRPTSTSHRRHPAIHTHSHNAQSLPTQTLRLPLRGPFTMHTYITNSLSQTHSHNICLHRDPSTFAVDAQAQPHTTQAPHPPGAQACPPTESTGMGRGRQAFPPAHLALVLSPKDTSSVSSEGPFKVTVQSPGTGVQRHKEVGKGTASRTGPLRPQSLLALL